MRPDDDVARLGHMLEAARKAAEFAGHSSREEFDHDEKLAFALTKLIEIVGEASKHVSKDFREAHPELPWTEMAKARDRLIHGYFDLDYGIIWKIATVHLPAVVTALEKVFPPEGQ
jgi:uncharacterized protein with HEPN domain